MALTSAPALGASSAWQASEGGRIRLLTTGQPDAAGLLRGALQVDLEPGWKTYWRDPGDSGVPPSIDVSRSASLLGAELAFPAPSRHDDGYGEWVGYDRSVAFPVSFTVDPKSGAGPILADVFLGICETICVPVNAKFTLDASDGADAAAAAQVVAAAQAALPGPARPDFGVSVKERKASELVLEARFPGGPETADLFIAGEQGFALARPEKTSAGSVTLFIVQILDQPAVLPAGGGLPYTLVTNAGAVSGRIPFR